VHEWPSDAIEISAATSRIEVNEMDRKQQRLVFC
jgi:hypothetical protein